MIFLLMKFFKGFERPQNNSNNGKLKLFQEFNYPGM